MQGGFVTTGPLGKPQLRTLKWGGQSSASDLSPTDEVPTSPCEPRGRSLGLHVMATGAPSLLEARTGRPSAAWSPPVPPAPRPARVHWCLGQPCSHTTGASPGIQPLRRGRGETLDRSQTCIHYSLQPVLKQCLFSKEYISGRVKMIQLSQATPASPRTSSALKEGSSLTSLCLR